MGKRSSKPLIPTSRRLHEAGFKNLDEATACTEAVFADLEAGRIDATEANRINSAVGLWRRTFVRKTRR